MSQFAHHNPLTVFDLMLNQIQAYVNLIQPLADSLKFLSPLASDALSCSSCSLPLLRLYPISLLYFICFTRLA